MTAAAVNKSGFVMLENDLLNIEKVAGKTFTGNMKITYSLIQGFEKNGQIAYFLPRHSGALSRGLPLYCEATCKRDGRDRTDPKGGEKAGRNDRVAHLPDHPGNGGNP